MSLNKINLLFIFLFGSFTLNAQNLLRKIPQDAKVVITFNTKAVFDHLKMEDLNLTLTRLGLFDKINDKGKAPIQKMQDLGIDWDAKAYAYVKGTDSIQYFGALIPLSDNGQFESLVPKHKKIYQENGLPTVYSTDRSLQLSWDRHTLYVMGGIAVDRYFKKQDVKDRYGLISDNRGYDQPYSLDAPIVDSVTTTWNAYDFDTETKAIVDSIEAIADSVADVALLPPPPVATDTLYPPVVIAAPPAAAIEVPDDYRYVDSVLAQEQYSDDYYKRYDTMYRHNDSVKREVVGQWIDVEMGMVITGGHGSFDTRQLGKLNSNTLAQIHVRDIASFYSHFYPEDIWRDAFGIQPKLDYGIEGVDASVIVQGNKLKFTGAATLDKDMTTYYKAIYNKKLNPKFYAYLDKDALGFFSFNLNTEAYIKYFPKILKKYYGSFMPRYEHAISLVAILFDVALDEKAIAKVFKGDNLFVLNGVTKVEVTYKDYEYDDNYNYKQVEKTKTETIPQFLWMFSSDDTRIFHKLAEVGIQEKGIIDHDGVYELKEKSKSGINVFFLIKDDMVFVGNDLEKLQSIRSNRLRPKGHTPYIALAKRNRLSLLFNTRQVPTLLEELDIPVQKSLDETIKGMAQYGDFYLLSSGVKGNKLSGEVAIDFPNTKGNALAFLFDVLSRWSLKK